MRLFFIYCLVTTLSYFYQIGTAQSQVDTNKVYLFAEEMPLIPTCVVYDTTAAAKYKCTQDLLLNYIYQNVQYPDSARFKGIEGTVVLSFVIGRDSTIKDGKVVKDIGGGCGAAALYVVNAMNPLNLKWAPGKKEGIPVDVQMTIPVKFKIKEVPPYVLVDRDTVYTRCDTPAAYKDGTAALNEYIANNLKYPTAGVATCNVGVIEVKSLVKADGSVEILEMADYSDLGMDFQFEAISTITASAGQWEAAEYKGRKVPTSLPIRLNFKPTAATCQTRVSEYEKAQTLAIEGSTLVNQEEHLAGIGKLDEAIALFPNNAEFLSARGQAHLDLDNREQACLDLTKVKEILLVSWVDNLLPLICMGVETEK